MALRSPLPLRGLLVTCAQAPRESPIPTPSTLRTELSPAVWCSLSRLYPTMTVTACQGLGFMVSLIGMAGIIASTCMDQWSTQDLNNNPVTAVYSYQGLWRSCIRESSGFTECRGYFTILGLPGKCGWGRQRRAGAMPLPSQKRATVPLRTCWNSQDFHLQAGWGPMPRKGAPY